MKPIPVVLNEEINAAPIDMLGMPMRYMNPGELEALIALARLVKPRTALEIGCNSGRTSRLLLENVGTITRMIGVDVPPGYQFEKTVQRREVPDRAGEYALVHPNFELRLSKYGSRMMVASDLPKLDFIFIDGDHAEAAVERDSELAMQCIRPGGMIVWHDYHDRGTVDVKQVVDGIRASGHDIRLVENTWLAFTVFGSNPWDHDLKVDRPPAPKVRAGAPA